MKYIILIAGISLITSLFANGQVITETVNFNQYQSGTNNDLVNNFSNGNGMIQVTSNGISGGSVIVPDSISWGNDNAVYCSRFHHISGDTLQASICFKFNTFIIQPSSFQRAVSLWMVPYADFNHYIVGTINYNQKMELITYGWSNNGGPVATLINNHWYRYELKAIVVGGINNQVNVSSSIFDLGVSGTTAPTLVNTTSGVINDNIIVADTSIQVSMTGTTKGGAVILDDFQFYGRKGVSTCQGSTGIQGPEAEVPVKIWVSQSDAQLNILTVEYVFSSITIYKVTGEAVLRKELEKGNSCININSLDDGFYIISLKGPNYFISRKIRLQRA